MHPHHHHHHHHHHQHHHSPTHQQALYAQQQQHQANLLFYQYNQSQSMQANYSNPTLPTMKYDQGQTVQQPYRPDQSVPSASPQSRLNTGAKRVSPERILSLPTPEAWLQRNSLQNPEVFRPIIRTISNSMLEAVPYPNNVTSASRMSASPPTPSTRPRRRHLSKQEAMIDDQQRRQRLHSGSSCYESDSPKNSSDDEEESQVIQHWTDIPSALFLRSFYEFWWHLYLYFISKSTFVE